VEDQRLNIKSTVAPIVHIRQGSKPIRKLMAPVTRYTRFVIFGKNFLWVLIALMIGAVIWTASEPTGGDSARIVFSNIPKSEELQNEMLKPHYQGLDANNNPYTVVADKAVQKDKETILLYGIRADMMQENDAWLALNAGQGELNPQSKQMYLFGGVNMFYEGGYEFESDHAQVDIAKGSAYGDAPVSGQGPMGTLKAKRFSVEDRGRIIRFNGSVIVKLYRK
jgi:lipopolysaccharide export system protein LptC